MMVLVMVHRNGKREEWRFLGALTGMHYLRALVLVPQIDTLERIRTDHVGARFVRRAVPLEVASHRCLAPLRTIHRRRQWQMFALESV